MAEKKNLVLLGGEAVIYQPAKGSPEVRMTLQDDTLWLSLNQIAEMFERDKSSISKHLYNIFKTKELARNQTVAFFATVQKEGAKVVNRKIEYYNLDAVISVGYRVNSKKGTQFRIWASGILKEHLVKGFSLNKKIISHTPGRFEELKSAVALLQRAAQANTLTSEEVHSVIDVIHDFAHALEVLDGYDHANLEITGTTRRKSKPITYEEAIRAITELGIQYQSSALFGREKDASFQSTIATIYQTFGGNELYPSIEEKAANLLYFTVKNHSFVDGNKRIAAFLFVWFLSRHRALYRVDGNKRIADNALVALCLMVAESKAQEKDLIVKVIINLINKKN